MPETTLNLLETQLEKAAVQEWLRQQGVPHDISIPGFVLHCLHSEGLKTANLSLAEEVLWNCTGFPAFWNIGKHGKHPVECLSTQVRGWARVALQSKDKAFRIMSDPEYSFEEALSELETAPQEGR